MRDDEVVDSVSSGASRPSEQVARLLTRDLGWPNATNVVECGAGAWSTAYRFSSDGEDLVIRIGAHERDFRADEAMAGFASDLLPIPTVHAVGSVSGASTEGEGEFFCVSAFVAGEPLESCASEDWPHMVESLADALEAMRAIPVPVLAEAVPWHEQLLALERGALDARLEGWRSRLAESERGSSAYSAGVGALESLDLEGVPLTLTHGDLINRNVHVVDHHISGIFDWGCQRWGDHLFDLAWFEFWSPWHPNLNIDMLRAALETRWADAGYTPDNAATRRAGNLLQIGIDHLAYNAAVGRPADLDDVVDRMKSLNVI